MTTTTFTTEQFDQLINEHFMHELHMFDIRDGKITRENVWCDLAAIRQQLGRTVS